MLADYLELQRVVFVTRPAHLLFVNRDGIPVIRPWVPMWLASTRLPADRSPQHGESLLYCLLADLGLGYMAIADHLSAHVPLSRQHVG